MSENRPFKLYHALAPFAWLYGAGVALRNRLFDWHLLKSEEFDIPVVSVGNLAVGGTGKTPHVEYLIRLLSPQYNIAVLSRGYKRKTQGFVLADEQATAGTIGDEPFQIARKFPHVTVAVDADRCHGIRKLRQLRPDVNLVLLDDAYQHRYVKPAVSVLLTDYRRTYDLDRLLPVGRLRESRSGARRAQIIVVTKCPDSITPIDMRITAMRLNPEANQHLYFSRFQYGMPKALYADRAEVPTLEWSENKDMKLLLVTGIANPQPICEYLEQHKIAFELLAFDDHHDFEPKDLEEIARHFDRLGGTHRYILTTEKDAARLYGNTTLDEALKSRIYVLPIEARMFPADGMPFDDQIRQAIGKERRIPEHNRKYALNNP